MERPARTRRRISVAEISTAGTSIVAATRADVGIRAPGRAKTTIRASPGSSAARCHASSSAAASAPSSRVNATPGSRARSASSVSTV